MSRALAIGVFAALAYFGLMATLAPPVQHAMVVASR